MTQRVLPHRQHRHRLDGTLQDGQSQRKLSGLAAHLNSFYPVGPAKQATVNGYGLLSLLRMCSLPLNLTLQPPHDFFVAQLGQDPKWLTHKLDSALYLCEAQLGCMNGAGTLFSSWMMVSLSVEMVTAFVPLIEPFHLNSPAGVMQNLWERCRLLSWS